MSCPSVGPVRSLLNTTPSFGLLFRLSFHYFNANDIFVCREGRFVFYAIFLSILSLCGRRAFHHVLLFLLRFTRVPVRTVRGPLNMQHAAIIALSQNDKKPKQRESCYLRTNFF